VKETKVRGAPDVLKNAFRSPRAVKAWVAGNGLWHRHVDVAEPRALVVRGRWPLRRESFLVMEDVSADGERLDLRSLRLWGGGPLDAAAIREKRAVVERLGLLVGGLHARGIYHGDLKAVNLFVREKHRRPSFCLVDYDRVGFGAEPVSLRRRVKNLAQLAASLGTYFSRGDRLRFYRSYASRLPGAWESRGPVARGVAEACARKIVVRREPIE
jgi:tRNA A-37 threonylcarbamoyl transferase component Bud32